MVSDRSIQTENHLFFWIFSPLAFFMQPPTHKKSCPSTFRLNIVGWDNLFHDSLQNTLRDYKNKNVINWGVSGLILSVLTMCDKNYMRYSALKKKRKEKKRNRYSGTHFQSEVLPIVLWRWMMPSILNYSWHPGCNSTFYHFLGYMVPLHCNK